MNGIDDCKIENTRDYNLNPTGGKVIGCGLTIFWQDGPLGRHHKNCSTLPEGGDCVWECTRKPPNGAFVETVISAAVQRLEFYQESKFECKENAVAIDALTEALESLSARTMNREKRAVEGTHAV